MKSAASPGVPSTGPRAEVLWNLARGVGMKELCPSFVGKEMEKKLLVPN